MNKTGDLFFQKCRTGRQNRYCLGVGTSGREGGYKEKEYRRVNVVEILCTTHVWKNETCGNYSRNRGRGDKGE
jgi:hypothetical protein